MEKQKKVMIVSLAVACFEEDVEGIEHEFNNADILQMGIFSIGTKVRPATKAEAKESLGFYNDR